MTVINIPCDGTIRGWLIFFYRYGATFYGESLWHNIASHLAIFSTVLGNAVRIMTWDGVAMCHRIQCQSIEAGTCPSRHEGISFLPKTMTYHTHKLLAHQLYLQKMWEQHSLTSQETCKINALESYKHLDTTLNRTTLVTKIDLRLLPGGSGEESTAFQSVLIR